MADLKALESCTTILSSLRKSGLHFVVQETPFSAYITIRKKFHKGFVSPSQNEEESDEKIIKLENEIKCLKNELEESIRVSETVKYEKEVFQKRLEIAEKGILKHIEDAKINEYKLNEEISNLKHLKQNLDEKILELNEDISKKDKNAKTLEKANTKLRTKNENLAEQNVITKADMNNNTMESFKLIEEIETLKAKISEMKGDILRASSPPSCSLSSTPDDTLPHDTPSRALPGSPPRSPSAQRTLPGTPPSPHTPPGLPPSDTSSSKQKTFVPEKSKDPTNHAQFSRNFLFSSPRTKSRDRCNHIPQCITREPLPPPFPSITFLHNENSQYHTHMMQWTEKEFAGCAKCFSIENENYGCRDCRWLKFWYGKHGETHGYPDVAAWVYKKYL